MSDRHESQLRCFGSQHGERRLCNATDRRQRFINPDVLRQHIRRKVPRWIVGGGLVANRPPPMSTGVTCNAKVTERSVFPRRLCLHRCRHRACDRIRCPRQPQSLGRKRPIPHGPDARLTGLRAETDVAEPWAAVMRCRRLPQAAATISRSRSGADADLRKDAR